MSVLAHLVLKKHYIVLVLDWFYLESILRLWHLKNNFKTLTSFLWHNFALKEKTKERKEQNKRSYKDFSVSETVLNLFYNREIVQYECYHGNNSLYWTREKIIIPNLHIMQAHAVNLVLPFLPLLFFFLQRETDFEFILYSKPGIILLVHPTSLYILHFSSAWCEGPSYLLKEKGINESEMLFPLLS